MGIMKYWLMYFMTSDIKNRNYEFNYISFIR
nr:MAG TPA: hypothetical protein [Caudoviricetes sp.]